MFRDKDVVRRYEQWEDSPAGRFALHQELRLLYGLMSEWPRRKQTLLDVGCGTGFFLCHFWESGFEVTGLDSSPAMLARAAKRCGTKADLHLGQAEHLPFDDKDFDFVTLFTVLEFCDNPGQVLQEARRVARKGLLIGFLNRYSLYYYLRQGRPGNADKKSVLSRARWFSCAELRRLALTHVGARPMKVRTVLPGPAWTWRESLPWRLINGIVLPGWCGAYGGLRIDLVGERPLTPLLAWKTQPKAAP